MEYIEILWPLWFVRDNPRPRHSRAFPSRGDQKSHGTKTRRGTLRFHTPTLTPEALWVARQCRSPAGLTISGRTAAGETYALNNYLRYYPEKHPPETQWLNSVVEEWIFGTSPQSHIRHWQAVWTTPGRPPLTTLIAQRWGARPQPDDTLRVGCGAQL